MNNEPKIDIEVDDNLNGILVIGCPECKSKSKYKMKSLSAGTEVKCSCGYTVSFADNELKKMQKSLTDFKRTLDNLF